jgi:hypothetical protein
MSTCVICDICGPLEISPEFWIDYCRQENDDIFTLINAEYTFIADETDTFRYTCNYMARVKIWAKAHPNSERELLVLSEDVPDGFSDSFEIEFNDDMPEVPAFENEVTILRNYMAEECCTDFKIEISVWIESESESSEDESSEAIDGYVEVQDILDPDIYRWKYPPTGSDMGSDGEVDDAVNIADVNCDNPKGVDDCFLCGDSVEPVALDVYLDKTEECELGMRTQLVASDTPSYIIVLCSYFKKDSSGGYWEYFFSDEVEMISAKQNVIIHRKVSLDNIISDISEINHHNVKVVVSPSY